MDGHGSHVIRKFLGFCQDNNILPLCLPLHLTHLLQLLDVSCFGPLAHYHQLGVENSAQQGIHRISKYEFLEIYSKAHVQTFTKQNILSAFHQSGLFLFNPLIVLRQISGQAITLSCCPDTSLSDQLQTPSKQLCTPPSLKKLDLYKDN